MQLTKDEIDALANSYRHYGEYATFDHQGFAAAVIAAHTAKVLGDVEPVAWQLFDKNGICAWDSVRHRVPEDWEALSARRCAEFDEAFPDAAPHRFVALYLAHTVAALAARVAELEKDAGPEEFTRGIDAAAKMLDKMADDYSNEHATQDPDTGVYEFGRGAKEDYYNTLRELADDIRSIVYAPGERENTAQTLKAAKDAAFEQAANLLEFEYAEDAKQKRRLDQIAQHIRDLKKRSS